MQSKVKNKVEGHTQIESIRFQFTTLVVNCFSFSEKKRKTSKKEMGKMGSFLPTKRLNMFLGFYKVMGP